MNPFLFVIRRPFTTLTLVVVLLSGGVLGLAKMRGDTLPPPLNTPKVQSYLEYIDTHATRAKDYVVEKYDSYFHKGHEAEEVHHEEHKIVVTSPKATEVTITRQYVCQIHSKRHIEVQAFVAGYLEEIRVREGQAVKQGDVMFDIKPILYQTKLAAETAHARLAELKYINTKTLAQKQFADKQPIVSQNEVLLFEAELAEAVAKQKQAQAELDFATIRAPFDGIIDRLKEQQGSLIKEGDVLTTLSDNSVMWVYFNVPEKQYLEYMAEMGKNKESPDIELVLANLEKYPHLGKIDPTHNIGAIEANFNPETGNIAFRADFPNPVGPAGERLLRHGQTGTVLINRTLKDALIIPQRATFENLAKRYVYILDKEDKVKQSEIHVQYELEDIYVIDQGVNVTDKIILEGIRQVHDGEKLEHFEFLPPDEVMAHQKNHAE